MISDEAGDATDGNDDPLGTMEYMAPEIVEGITRGKRKLYINPWKADVFSLGLTMLEIITQKSINGLNDYRRNEELLRLVDNKIEYFWAKSMLKDMLNCNPRERPEFKKLLQYFPVKRMDTIIIN